MIEFGTKLSNQKYTRRSGVYAVLIDQEGRIGVVKTPKGYFLVGGGIDEGEESEAALKREALEEIGMSIEVLEKIGEATDHAFVPEFDGYYSKEGQFYKAVLVGIAGKPIDLDHEFQWLPREEAIEKMYYGSQRWAIEKSL